MSKEKRYLTHVVCAPLPKSGLRKLSFLTRKEITQTPEKYFVDFSSTNFPNKELAIQIADGRIVALRLPEQIERGEDAWVDTAGNYFIADVHNPLGDKKKRKIEVQKKFVK